MTNTSTYKQTPIGLIPTDWEVKKMGEIALVDNESLKSTTEPNYEFDYISLSDVDSDFFQIETTKQIFKNAPSRARRIVKKGDILMSTVRPNLQGFSIVSNVVKDLIASTGFAVITASNCNNYFLYQYIFSNPIQKQFYNLIVGSNYPAINSSDVKQLYIPIPPLPEQEKIATILSTWDAAIAKCKVIIEQLKIRNKGLLSELLSSEKRKIINPFLKEVLVRNKNLEVTRVLSVTNSRGFINQDEQFGRVVASKDLSNYKIIIKNQFAYNPARINVGSLDLLKKFDIGILSPMYVVFKTDEKQLLTDYFHYCLKSNIFKNSIQNFLQGSVRDSLSFEALCSMKFAIPPLQTQQKIACILDKAFEEATHFENLLKHYQLQKKGLMQQLLTGKTRVKI
ncbi:MAG: restriction endonuclease subunit S [Sediminibacterium sp.]|nr:restriction endonuclease subunit S [Sediminibacterium sp.]